MDPFYYRTNSPNLFLQRSHTPSEPIDVIPPPPPRRYMRCLSGNLSSDIDKMATLEEKKLTSSLLGQGRPPPVPTHNTFHKVNSVHYTPQPTSERILNPAVTQSLRCKSSYAIQLSPLLINNSPTLLAQHQLRKATAKRLSTISSSYSNGQPARPQSQTVFPAGLRASSSGDRADSDFTFIPTKSISIRSNLDTYRHFNTTSTTPKNAHLLPQQGPHRNMLTSSASLVLNSRRKQNWADLERKVLATPPPVPPHRTHLHHF